MVGRVIVAAAVLAAPSLFAQLDPGRVSRAADNSACAYERSVALLLDAAGRGMAALAPLSLRCGSFLLEWPGGTRDTFRLSSFQSLSDLAGIDVDGDGRDELVVHSAMAGSTQLVGLRAILSVPRTPGAVPVPLIPAHTSYTDGRDGPERTNLLFVDRDGDGRRDEVCVIALDAANRRSMRGRFRWDSGVGRGAILNVSTCSAAPRGSQLLISAVLGPDDAADQRVVVTRAAPGAPLLR